jgi:cytochrome c553
VRAATADEAVNDGLELFEKQIRPLLIAKCAECHGDKKQEGNLRLTSREAILRGGDNGKALVPEKPDESLLIKAVGYLDEPKMPPTGKLADAEIAKLKQWVSLGAPWPNEPVAPGPRTEPKSFKVTPGQQSWWAFQPVKDAALPTVKDGDWCHGELDRFILAEFEARGMSPTAPAERRVWLRRVTFDLTGLPPTPEEVAAFLADESVEAEAKVVDRLLASPAYGQRYARHWLDVVRYADYHDADAKARDATCEPLEAWRYRDWVVNAFNRDLPFDQFITMQIAGDLLPNPDGSDFHADGLVATTFLSNGAWDRGDADKEKLVSDMVDDNVDTIGKAFLGLGLGCARCHDHKFDPISQADYYGLAGVFYSTHFLSTLGTKGGNYTLQRVSLLSPAEVAIRSPEDKSPIPQAEAATEGGTPGGLFPGIQDVPLHIRGSYTRPGAVVPRRMPSFLAGENQPVIQSGSGRREVAAWIASAKNPLTARVIVNRVWKWHFGEGLVRTPNNFGLRSEPPSHPALLDWLANRFVEEGWSLKDLHRRIVLSATYRQSSFASDEQVNRDPENRWLGRFTGRRMEAESLRDAMLAVSGGLDPARGGPALADLAAPCRSLYIQTARWDRSNFATLFDAANPDSSVESRTTSTVAPQALFLLNNPFVLNQAKNFAERLARDVPDGVPTADAARIQRAYQLLYGRPAHDEELAIAHGIISAKDGWTDLAHILLCTNEFVHLD